jgi:hypothetical protein
MTGALAVAALGLAAPLRAQTEAPVELAVQVAVVCPQPLATNLADALRAGLPEVPVRIATAASLEGGTPTVVVGAGELELWRLRERLEPLGDLGALLPGSCRDPDGRWVLPWSLHYVVARTPDTPPRAEPWTLEALALDRALDGRLGLCPPDVDPAPWLAAMEDWLRGGRDEAAGFALWGTLDARVGDYGYAPDHAALARDLAAHRLAAAVLPACVLRTIADGVRSEPLGPGTPRARLGLAVLRGSARERAFAVAARALQLGGEDGFQAATGLEPPASGAGALDGERADGWLRRFAAEIRGHGAGAERTADVVDLVFEALFAAGVLAVLFFARRRARSAGSAGIAGSASLLLLLPLLLLGTGCVYYEPEILSGPERRELATVVRPDGAVERYFVEPGRGGDASLQIVTETERERPYLGLRVVDLDVAEAERRGLRPFQGLLVTGTYPHSAAEAAGIAAGDVLLALDGQPTVYADQLPHAEAKLVPGKAVPARFLRGLAETEVSVQPAVLKERVVDPQDVALIEGRMHKAYAGLVLRGIPRAYAGRMFGDARNGVLISGVDVGSPAWLAGFRGGDLVESVDGGPVPALDELSDAMERRGEQNASIRLAVRRDAGDRHDASIALSDYRAARQVWVPLVADVEDGYREDLWSVGPFGLICGHKSRFVADASTRAPRTRSVFDAVFGLVHVDSGDYEHRLRLLWLIDIDL